AIRATSLVRVARRLGPVRDAQLPVDPVQVFFFSSRRRHTRSLRDWSSDVCSSDLDANWHPETEEDKCATGTLIGSGIGGLSGIADTALLLKERGPRRVSPFFIPGRLINLASGYVSIEHGLKGPNHSVVTACSTGAHAIGD